VNRKSLSEVKTFIDRAGLPPTHFPGRTRAEIPPGQVALTEKAGQQKAAIVGSEILSFSDEVPTERRTAILNCALLAQLIAKDRVPGASALDKWYEVYFDSLANLGWAVGERSWTDSLAAGDEFSVHKAVLELVAAFLGETASAYLLVKTTLDALRSMDKEASWLTLFNREAHSQNSAKFQIGAVSGNGTNLNIALMAFTLQSTSDITSILFFKARKAEVNFRKYSANTAIDTAILDEIAPLIQKKLVTRATDYILGLPQLK
jgi:hypothetical protein